MDTLSHGLWGGILFGRSNRKSFWLSFSFGVLPDILVFGPIFAAGIFSSLMEGGEFMQGPPDVSTVPRYVFQGYNLTHSFIVFAAAFLLVWAMRKKPLLEMLAWPAHILLDIPTHSSEFFPTPFLWPFPHQVIDGVPWSHPFIFFPNIFLLAALYAWYFVIRRKMRKKAAVNFLSAREAEIDKKQD